jgi:hypothetical protein
MASVSAQRCAPQHDRAHARAPRVCPRLHAAAATAPRRRSSSSSFVAVVRCSLPRSERHVFVHATVVLSPADDGELQRALRTARFAAPRRNTMRCNAPVHVPSFWHGADAPLVRARAPQLSANAPALQAGSGSRLAGHHVSLSPVRGSCELPPERDAASLAVRSLVAARTIHRAASFAARADALSCCSAHRRRCARRCWRRRRRASLRCAPPSAALPFSPTTRARAPSSRSRWRSRRTRSAARSARWTPRSRRTACRSQARS